MDPCPEPPDLAHLLPRHAYYQLIHTLRGGLPPPVTDTPEDIIRRDNAAIAQVAGLLPATAGEAALAGQFVAANAQAMDCLRLARQPGMDPALVLKCSAQSASMMRQAQSGMRLLQHFQATRQTMEADNAALDRAAWTEHCAAGLMAQALPPPPMPAEPLPAVAPEPAFDTEPAFDPVAAAEEYAMLYPERAALIRRLGGLPEKVSFGRPEEALVRALVAGRSEALLALDRQSAISPHDPSSPPMRHETRSRGEHVLAQPGAAPGRSPCHERC